ncbi:Rv3852 family protein [Mycobacterium sp. Marseille-P9652]|uniref:Rv3852 family protein n=1 Tax=Mycobacterium sp. Marseille-P9652 TaxID=2654950 RepID=UPI0012E873C6|nr:nucleoid-structuring protein H-NS [Mycobacterium sp. Marseille-P9652]
MAEPQDQPNGAPIPPEAAQEIPPETPPQKKPPAKAAKKAAKAPAKKAPAKKAPAKKAPAKKAPAKKVPPRAAEPAAPQPLAAQQRIETNGDLAAAAKDVAAQAKSTVEAANDPVAPDVRASALTQSPLPLIVALAVSLLAILLIRQLRRR